MAEKGPSLDDVFKGVPPAKLDWPCRDRHLSQVACRITNWPTLALQLRMKEYEMEQIMAMWPRDAQAQSAQMLRMWRNKFADKATYRWLCQALWEVGNRRLVNKLCHLIARQEGDSERLSESSEDEDSSLPSTKKAKTSPVVGLTPFLSAEHSEDEGTNLTPCASHELEPYTMSLHHTGPPSGGARRENRSSKHCDPTFISRLECDPSPPPRPKPRPRKVVSASVPGCVAHLPPTPLPQGSQQPQETEGPPHCRPSLLQHTDPSTPATIEVDPLDPYVEFLREMYGRIRPQFLVLQWPPPPTRKVFNLAMIHTKDTQCGPVDEELVRLLQRGNVVDFVNKRTSIHLQDLFKLDNEDRKIILIEGAPGSGKSTLAWHACQQWKARELFQEFRIVVFVQLRDPRVQSAQSIADLLPAGSEERRRDAAEAIKACQGRVVLFVLDGWDEYGQGLETDSIVCKLICKSDELNMSYSTLLITSRPIASAALQQLASSRVEIVGFTREEVSQYFQEVLKDPVAVQTLQAQLKDRPVIEASCYLPLNAAIVAHLFKWKGHVLPRTLHGVFSDLVCHCIVRYMKKQSGKAPHLPSLSKLPPEVQPLFDHLCVLAYEASMKNKATFISEDLSSYRVSVEGNGLELMQVVPNLSFGESESYHFLHLSVQELLAAVHVSKLGGVDQVNVFRELFSEPRLVSVFRFYSALTKLKAEGIREVIATVIGRRPGYPSSPERERWRQHVLNILHCLYEAQDVSLCFFVASWLDEGLDLYEISLSPLDCLCVGFFLCCVCGTREGEFEVNLRSCGLDSYNVGLITKELSKVSGGGTNTVVGCLGLNIGGYNNIGGSGVHLLCELMICNLRLIRRLDLSHNKIQDAEDGLLCLLHMLCSNRWLVEVNLDTCGLKINAENGPVLVRMLHRNSTLKELNLCYNEIDDIGVGYIVDGMMAKSGVATLDLTRCGIGEEGGRSLGRMLTENRTLEHLDIGSNEIGDIGVSYIAEGMMANSGVTTLDLYECGIGEEGGRSLGRMLTENRTLEHLNISDNKIGDIGVSYIADGMMANNGVTTLKLSGCGIEEGGRSLGRMLTENRTLEHLGIGGNKIGDIGVGYIAEGMIVNRGVRNLDLPRCGIHEGTLLSRLLTENRTLEQLDISGNCLYDDGIVAVGEALKVNCRLEELVMKVCWYSFDGLKEFVSCLRENSHLRRLRVWGVRSVLEPDSMQPMDRDQASVIMEAVAAVNNLRQQRGEPELVINT